MAEVDPLGDSGEESVHASLDPPLFCLVELTGLLAYRVPYSRTGQIDILRRARRTAFETLLRRTTPRQPREVMSRRAQKYVKVL